MRLIKHANGDSAHRHVMTSAALVLAGCAMELAWPAIAAVDPGTLPEINLHCGANYRLVVFADLMAQANGLIMGDDPAWAEKVELDDQGWIKTPMPDRAVWFKPSIEIADGQHLPGVYVLTWKGSGDVALNGSSRKHEILLDDKANKRMVVRLPADQSPLIEVRNSDAGKTGDYIRDIRLWPPSKANGGAALTKGSDLSPGKVADNLEPAPSQPAPVYHPFFVEHLRSVPFGVYRLMSFNQVNSPDPHGLDAAKSWANRRPDRYRTYQYKKGTEWPTLTQAPKASLQVMSYEQQIAIANDFDTDIWINIPHTASKEFIQELAKLCAGKLESGRRVWVELSNETWNSYPPYLPQQTAARKAAAEHFGVPLDKVDQIGPQHGWGSAKIQCDALKPFADAFIAAGQPPARMVKVLAGFPANPAYNIAMLNAANEICPGIVDVFAVTHYWGHSARFDDLDYAKPTEAVWKAAFERLEPYIYADFNHGQTRDAAAKLGVPVIAYEGSHHVTAGGKSADKDYVAFLRAMQYRPEMGDLHRAQWAYWRVQGLATASAFVDCAVNALSYGQWGFKEFVTQTPEDAPKWKALQQWGETQKGVRSVLAPKGAAPAFQTTRIPPPEVGKPYSATIAVKPGDGATSILLLGGALPDGLSLKDNGDGTATISGAATRMRQCWFTLRALDADKDPAYQMLTTTPELAGVSSNTIAAFRGADIPGKDYGPSQNRRFDFRLKPIEKGERFYVPFNVGPDGGMFAAESGGKPGAVAPDSPCNLRGGWSFTGANASFFTGLRDGAFRSWHGTSPPSAGGTPAPSVFDACLVLTKAQFAGKPAQAAFGNVEPECALLVEIDSITGDGPEIRFIVQNAGIWYISEANASKAGIFCIDNFNNRAEPGKRWGVFRPEPDNFAIPNPLPEMKAVDFNDVQAFGIAVKDRRGGYHYMFSMNRLLAIGNQWR